MSHLKGKPKWLKASPKGQGKRVWLPPPLSIGHLQLWLCEFCGPFPFWVFYYLSHYLPIRLLEPPVRHFSPFPYLCLFVSCPYLHPINNATLFLLLTYVFSLFLILPNLLLYFIYSTCRHMPCCVNPYAFNLNTSFIFLLITTKKKKHMYLLWPILLSLFNFNLQNKWLILKVNIIICVMVLLLWHMEQSKIIRKRWLWHSSFLNYIHMEKLHQT